MSGATAVQSPEWWSSEGSLIEATVEDLKRYQERLRVDRCELLATGAGKKSEAITSVERKIFEIGYRLRSWERYAKMARLRECPIRTNTDTRPTAKVIAVSKRPRRKKAAGKKTTTRRRTK